MTDAPIQLLRSCLSIRTKWVVNGKAHRYGIATGEMGIRGSRYTVTYYNEEKKSSRGRIKAIHDASFGEVRQ